MSIDHELLEETRLRDIEIEAAKRKQAALLDPHESAQLIGESVLIPGPEAWELSIEVEGHKYELIGYLVDDDAYYMYSMIAYHDVEGVEIQDVFGIPQCIPKEQVLSKRRLN